MSIIYTMVGLLFIIAISLWAIAWCCFSLANLQEERKNNAYSQWAKNVCHDLDRWCDYEFPQVGFVAREINNAISSGWSFDVSRFRDQLRNKEYEKKSTSPTPTTPGKD